GFRLQYTHPWYQIGVEPKVALGVNQYQAQVIAIDPVSFDTDTERDSTVFTAIGHLNVFAKLKITDHFRGYVAYNLFGLSGISRPHEQIRYDLDSNLDNNVHLRTDLGGFMFHGYSVGGEVNF